MSRESIKSVIITYLDKNPKLEEALQIALENRFIDLPSMLTRYNSRTEYMNLLSAKTVEELDKNLVELTKNELSHIYNLLPQPYENFFKFFLALYDLDRIHQAIISNKFPNVATTFFNPEYLNVYSHCTKEKTYDCLLQSFIQSIKTSLEVSTPQKIFEEDPSKAFQCIALLVAINYAKHTSNLERLGIAFSHSLKDFLKQITSNLKIDGMLSYMLESSVNHMLSIFRSQPSKSTLHEANYVYYKCRDILLFSPQVIDLLTLYLVNRYYEIRVLRYVFPVSWVIK